ncbi:glycosyltransferase family 50 protein [Hygrophoropsis aurantiaca]|uniref:Glycosyltransferase family 50 protein n=1 Tax=Hygrophoropsis aurantiaca TaxID=72124 RepID=A0ACB8AG48_9AGAM|nr:glycosyltransferase family 50 protein [Hygrophoropsis aurantiaca]
MSRILANWHQHIPSFRTILSISATLRIALIVYSEWHDARSTVKYTDIDYRVFSDAARFILHPTTEPDNTAKGPLVHALGWKIGDPYTRDTYRYTPLLALFLLPNEWVHPSFGKYLFATCDLLNGVLIYRLLVSTVLPSAPRFMRINSSEQKPSENETEHTVRSLNVAKVSPDSAKLSRASLLAATYLLNPLVFAISTRGSSESLLATLVLLTLTLALDSRWDTAALLLGISAHWKIYPVIYGLGCLGVISAQANHNSGWGWSYLKVLVNLRTIRFALFSAGTFIMLGAACYPVWGYPFLYEAYLYHLDRLDHRHNFSPYFYLIYLTYPTSANPDYNVPQSLWERLIRSPLTSLIPQLTLSLGTGLLFGRKARDLPFTWFVQTYTFVLFNRVCTSQYFLWYLLFAPLLAPHVRLSWRALLACIVVWAGTQGLWLAEAYRLEFLGENVFLSLWARSLLYVAGHTWVLGKIMDGYGEGAN